MTKRKKRLEKGIISIEKRIKEHEERKKKAEDEGDVYLVEYLGKEITSLKERKENRKKVIEKL